jgi:hypothetical protein
LDADEPPLLLSEDIAPNPVEYALTALAACVTTSIKSCNDFMKRGFAAQFGERLKLKRILYFI